MTEGRWHKQWNWLLYFPLTIEKKNQSSNGGITNTLAFNEALTLSVTQRSPDDKPVAWHSKNNDFVEHCT